MYFRVEIIVKSSYNNNISRRYIRSKKYEVKKIEKAKHILENRNTTYSTFSYLGSIKLYSST